MRQMLKRNALKSGLVLLIGFVAWGGVCGHGLAADAPKPAKKDSRPGIKPKTAELTASVTPAEAKPGDIVTFQVTAKLDPGYHIYQHSKSEGGSGPVNTTFDFFDTAGLTIEGDWSASKPPERHKDPNFADVEFVEYFEDEVTWSIKLRVPAGTEPGKKALRCQAGYMVCDASHCSIPGRWTLPDAVLTITRGGAEPIVDAPRPAKKDSRLAKPKTVVLTTSVTPTQATPGDTVTFHVSAKLDPGYHIYKYSKEEGGSGYVNTTFDFFDTAGLSIEGDWSASRTPVKHKDPNLADIGIIEYFENEVTWSIKLRVPAGMEPGNRVVRCQAGYQVCDARSCTQPGQWTLPAAVLAIIGGDAQGTAGTSGSHVQPGGPGSSQVAPAAASASPASNPTAGIGSQAAASADNSASAVKADGVSEAKFGSAAATEPGPGLASKSSNASQAGGLASPLPAASGVQVQSEIAQEAERGLIPFLIASALGGLFALVMPCVWPMIPITVNFFVKQGQGPGGRSRTTGLAIIYCLSIIAVFTAVGVLFAFFFSAASLQNLANNPWLNLLVAALFVIFGISLLGLFELRLPNFLLNASAHGESRGGLIGVVFMALTLTITSFTCTFPVVGGLLVMAAGGSFLYPIIGLATFAAVLAFPFFLLALSPSLIASMPRSGDWMNAVKVVGGLVEIGAALKFVNTAELAFVTPENAWFDAHVVLTSWIALSAVCGVYLLGLFRTNHDHDEVKVGPGRLVFGTLFLGLALYMSPALFGRPPRSLIWDRLIVGILPPDSNELTAETAANGAGAALASAAPLQEVKATSTEPSQAEREEKKAHGVLWGMSFDQAREQAALENKPILIDFTGVNCPNCRLMERHVLPRPEVVSLLKQFVTVQLYTDFVPIGSLTAQQRAELAEINQDRLLKLAQEQTNPIYVVLSPSGELLNRIGGYREPKVFVDFLATALSKVQSAGKAIRSSSAGGRMSGEMSLATANGR